MSCKSAEDAEKKENKILRNMEEVENQWKIFIFLLLLAMHAGYEGKASVLKGRGRKDKSKQKGLYLQIFQ